ncbi:hypothetical protein T01_3328 [Trichinella spiralis]|uniref:Uncharacterized protein n=1 Tax=Trichinella spiralis TaxID=6334 RepID=A0A0V1C252_TRISP|nr:hypothetical protein T01_3328 [Trichinella spiralis]
MFDKNVAIKIDIYRRKLCNASLQQSFNPYNLRHYIFALHETFFINRVCLFLKLLTAVQYLPVFPLENEYLAILPKAMRYASYIIHILVYNVSECHLHCQFLNVSA